MNSWVVFWLCLAAALAIVEVSTVNLITIWFAAAALVVALAAVLGVGAGGQVAIFIIVSAVLVVATRPIAKRFLNKKAVPTNADRIIGAEGVVVEEIDAVKGCGQVKVLGQIWSAKSVDGKTLAEGTVVEIVALEGVKAVVSARAEQ